MLTLEFGDLKEADYYYLNEVACVQYLMQFNQ